VRTNTLAGPGADAAIVRIKENGVSVAMSLDGNARYCYLSPREGAKLAVAECCRNLATVGAQPVAATNCLNFANPERPEIMGQLVDAIDGMSEACRLFETPITGGNVSLYNETLREGIWPTPVIGIVGLMRTAAPVTREFKTPGRPVVLLGGIGTCDETHFGGTEYAKVILNELWGLPPALDMEYEKRVHDAMREIIAEGLAESAHDVSDGGLAVATAECCLGGVGAALHFESDLAPDFLLFHEGPSRILLTTANPARVAEIAARHRVAAPQVGLTMKAGMAIGNHGAMLVSITLDHLRPLYENALESQLKS
jgi:phosphoribosylformylglycinamidine synthase